MVNLPTCADFEITVYLSFQNVSPVSISPLHMLIPLMNKEISKIQEWKKIFQNRLSIVILFIPHLSV